MSLETNRHKVAVASGSSTATLPPPIGGAVAVAVGMEWQLGVAVGLILASFPGSEVVTDELELIRQARFAAEWNEAQR
jgi:hypothetical protein